MLHAYLLLGMSVVVTDILYRRISNFQVALFAIIAIVLVIRNSAYWEASLSFFIVLPVAILLFVTRTWGGGDSKLLLSLAPLVSVSVLPDLFISILVCGGILSFIYFIKCRIFNFTDKGLPYGVAIIFGFSFTSYLLPGTLLPL